MPTQFLRIKRAQIGHANSAYIIDTGKGPGGFARGWGVRGHIRHPKSISLSIEPIDGSERNIVIQELCEFLEWLILLVVTLVAGDTTT